MHRTGLRLVIVNSQPNHAALNVAELSIGCTQSFCDPIAVKNERKKKLDATKLLS